MSYVSGGGGLSRALRGDSWPDVQHAAAGAGCLAPVECAITGQRVERSIGEARTIGGRLRGLSAFLHRIEAAPSMGPRILAAGITAVTDAHGDRPRGDRRWRRRWWRVRWQRGCRR